MTSPYLCVYEHIHSAISINESSLLRRHNSCVHNEFNVSVFIPYTFLYQEQNLSFFFFFFSFQPQQDVVETLKLVKAELKLQETSSLSRGDRCGAAELTRCSGGGGQRVH